MKGNIVYEEKGRRYFVYIAISFILGVFYSIRNHININDLYNLKRYSAIFFMCTIFLLVGTIFMLRKVRDIKTDIILTYFMLLFFSLGMYRTAFYENVQYKSLKSSAEETRTYTGVVTGEPALSGSGKTYGFSVKVLGYEDEEGQTNVDGNIMLYASIKEGQVERGDVISFEVCLKESECAPYKGGFSMKSYLYRQNLCYSAYTKNLEKTNKEYNPTIKDRLYDIGYTIQSGVSSAIDKNFGEVSRESALLKGIILGVKEDFSGEQYENFSKSGLIHIIAVSGMHIMFLFNTLLYCMRKLRLPKLLAYFIIAPCLFIFSATAMFTPSVCRAVIMMTMFMLAYILQGEPDGITSIFIAATIIIMINPYAITSYSFILSFSTTLGIILFSAPLNSYLKQIVRMSKLRASKKLFIRGLAFLLNVIITSLSVTISSNIGMGYFGARFFKRFSWGSIFANIALLYLAGACFVFGILSCAISGVLPELAKAVTIYLLKPMLCIINVVAEFFSKRIFVINLKTPPESWFIIYCILARMFHYFLVTKPIQIGKSGLHK